MEKDVSGAVQIESLSTIHVFSKSYHSIQLKAYVYTQLLLHIELLNSGIFRSYIRIVIRLA